MWLSSRFCIRVCSIAIKHLHSVQVCIGRLQQLGGHEELKLLADCLQRLSFGTVTEDKSGRQGRQ